MKVTVGFYPGALLEDLSSEIHQKILDKLNDGTVEFTVAYSKLPDGRRVITEVSIVAIGVGQARRAVRSGLVEE